MGVILRGLLNIFGCYFMHKAKTHATLKSLLAFDFGTRSIGVAIGQLITKTAEPLPAINAKNGIPNIEDIAKLINIWHPDALVVGKPTSESGGELEATKPAAKFVENLEKYFKLPVYMINEHLTTVAAKEKLFTKGGYRALKKSAVDSVSAQLILESFMQNLGD